MSHVDPQLTAGQVLHAFNYGQIYLFLGAAITTVGLVAAAISLVRRRLDPLLLWFALFAVLYGARLWMDYQPTALIGSESAVFDRLRRAIDYLIPLPAFFFFRSLNLLSRLGRIVSYIITPIVLCIAPATLIFGPLHIFRVLNNTVVTAALLVLAFNILRLGSPSRDLTLIRRGLFLFIASALYDNVSGLLHHFHNIEPFCFVILLACLGVVAVRRALRREQQLSVIEKELEIAKRIQLSILPPTFPASTSLRVAARYVPMTSVAGDFYDFLLADDRRAGILIADVSGHGIPAALIASMVKLAATSQRSHAADPPMLLAGMNAALCGNTQSQFVTAAYVYLDLTAKLLCYAAAAHPPMLLLRSGKVTPVVENGLMLAAFDFATYTSVSLPLEPGDRLLLYTDGILEAASSTAEEFGHERLARLLEDTAHTSHTETADRIVTSVQQWSASQEDDLTVLVCDFQPAL